MNLLLTALRNRAARPRFLACIAVAGAAACSGGSTATPADSTPNGSQTGETGAPANTSGHTGYTGPTVTVRYVAWEADRECFAIRDVERPEALWGTWVANECDILLDDYAEPVVYWVTEGHCARFGQDLVTDDCAVSDPSWVQPCDASKHSCCTEDSRRLCSPDPYYQP